MRVPLIAILAVLALSSPGVARADEYAEFVQIICVEALDMVEVRPVTVNGPAAVAAVRRWPDALKRRHGFYALRPLMVVRAGQVQQVRTRTVDCRLSRGRVRIAVTPLPGNVNLAGRCGGALSIELTVHDGSRLLVDRLPFERDCNRPHRIDRFVYIPNQDLFYLDGTFPAPPETTAAPASARTNPADGPGRLTFFTDAPDFAVVQRGTIGF
jgi:hypothetical protein